MNQPLIRNWSTKMKIMRAMSDKINNIAKSLHRYLNYLDKQQIATEVFFMQFSFTAYTAHI